MLLPFTFLLGLKFPLLGLTQRWSFLILHEPFQGKLAELLLSYQRVKKDPYAHTLCGLI